MRLTDAAIARLRPAEREYTVWDTRTPGLGVRVRPSGGVSFVLLHKTDGRSRRTSLGAVAARSVDAVRRACHAAIAGGAPDGAARPEAPLFRDFVAGPWTDAHFPKYKPSTRKQARAALTNQLLPAFGATPLDRITRAQVLEWFDAYSETAPGGANHTARLLRQVLNFAVTCGHIATNPARAIEPNRRSPLTRFLSREEVRRLHRALDRHAERSASARQQADIIRLLLLTGCRKNEILALRWAEVHADTLALADSKTGPRKVPLNAKAQAVIARQPRGGSPFVFPSPRDSARPRTTDLPLWDTVRREAGIEDVRLHTLRHTVASHAVMNGVPVPVVSRLLGHTNAQMTLRYAHLADRDIEAAAERIGAGLARLMAFGSCRAPGHNRNDGARAASARRRRCRAASGRAARDGAARRR